MSNPYTVDPLVQIAQAINRLAAAVERLGTEEVEPGTEKPCAHVHRSEIMRPGIEPGEVFFCTDCNQEIKAF